MAILHAQATLLVSVSVPAQGAPARLLSGVRNIHQLFGEHQLPCTWFLAHGALDPLASVTDRMEADGEVALLGPADSGNLSAVVASLNALRRIGNNSHSAFIKGELSTDLVQLLAKNRIEAICRPTPVSASPSLLGRLLGERPKVAQPQALRWGLREIVGGCSFERDGARRGKRALRHAATNGHTVYIEGDLQVLLADVKAMHALKSVLRE